MHESIQAEKFQDLFRYPAVIDFSRRVVLQSYTECAPGYEAEMQDLLTRAFALLESCSHGQDFRTAITTLSQELFRKQDTDFWFNRIYRHYKRDLKPEIRYEKLHTWIQGKRVLDFGSGDGLTSSILHDHGYEVSLCDILDYRDEKARSFPFAQLTDPRHIPWQDRSFDTAIILAVLHHVEKEDLLLLLAELRRTSRRLIIEEDSYLVPEELPGLKYILRQDAFLTEFLATPAEDQLRYLMFIDYFANAIAQGLSQMDMPFNFKSVPEWQALFESQGFLVANILPMGFQPRQFNRSCHIWFILDVI